MQTIDDYAHLSQDENGNLLYDGKLLPKSTSDSLKQELELLGLDLNGTLTQEDLPSNTEEDTDNKMLVTDKNKYSYVS
jgi:hypothetical protein